MKVIDIFDCDFREDKEYEFVRNAARAVILDKGKLFVEYVRLYRDFQVRT